MRERRLGEDEEEKGGTFMWSHTRDYHGGIPGPEDGRRDYKMVVEDVFRDTLTRQTDEAVKIKNCDCTLMNGKNEWFAPKTIQTIFKQL